MFNSIRRTEYYNTFMQLLQNFYKNEVRVIPVTYLLWSPSNSTYDNINLDAGSYRKVGNLSGLQWYKILYYPVAGTEQMVPPSDADEGGIRSNEETTCFFPKIQFDPTMFDFVIFNLFGTEIPTCYQVAHFEKAYIDYVCPIYKIRLVSTPYTITNFNDRIVETYAYNEVNDKIQTVNDFNTSRIAMAKLLYLSPLLRKATFNNKGVMECL